MLTFGSSHNDTQLTAGNRNSVLTFGSSHNDTQLTAGNRNSVLTFGSSHNDTQLTAGNRNSVLTFGSSHNDTQLTAGNRNSVLTFGSSHNDTQLTAGNRNSVLTFGSVCCGNPWLTVSEIHSDNFRNQEQSVKRRVYLAPLNHGCTHSEIGYRDNGDRGWLGLVLHQANQHGYLQVV